MTIATRKNEMVCELALAKEITEAEAVLRQFYFNEYIDLKLLPRLARIQGNENAIAKQTEIAFMDYFQGHVSDGRNAKASERDAIYAALGNRVAEMEDSI